MDLTLDQLLTIIGRLDDTLGFDTPRERFRRFLNERMTSLESARLLIQQCREHAGEQSHRALQDVVVFSGRLLGFDTTFGRYQHDAGAAPTHGVWQLRRRLHVTLTVCSDQTTAIDLDALSRAASEGDTGTPRLGLLVMTSFYVGKDRLEQALGNGTHTNLRVISLGGLLRLCAMAEEGQLTPDDVLQLFNPGVTLDSRLDLLERVAAAARRQPTAESVTSAVESEHHERRYWVNAMRLEPFSSTERSVRSLIVTRQILGINPAPGLEDRVRAGDAICVFVAGRGIVAHAQIAGMLTDGSRLIRDSKQFTHVLRLTDAVVYETPVIPSLELARKLDLALMGDVAALTTPISPREFESITAHALSATG